MSPQPDGHGLDDPEYRPISGCLYHYTSIDAFLSIAQHKVLRATKLEYLNDAAEGITGFSRIREAVDQDARAATGIERALLEKLSWWIDHRYLVVPGSVYVLCFSQARDQLSQWRGYTAHGRGISLGIPVDFLVPRMQQVGSEWRFQNCRYSLASQMSFARAVVARVRTRAKEEQLNSTAHADLVSVINKEAQLIFQTAALMKNDAFSQEAEVRFISSIIGESDPRVRFRAGRTSIVPYIEFRLADDQSQEIPTDVEVGIGPGPTQELAHNAVAQVATCLRLARAVNYWRSIVPYREL